MVKLLLTEFFVSFDSYQLRPSPLTPLRGPYSMADRSDVARGRTVVERWCLLAEQRFDYLTELYESGRWRRFHSERDFLENIEEAKRAVTTWRGLLNSEAAPDNRPISLSWLSNAAPLSPRRPALFADELPTAIPASVDLPVERAPPVVPADIAAEAADTVPAPRSWQAIDFSVMQQRYPMLRTA
jgi:uncharacterized repeat protein (TIGR03809 family)